MDTFGQTNSHTCKTPQLLRRIRSSEEDQGSIKSTPHACLVSSHLHSRGAVQLGNEKAVWQNDRFRSRYLSAMRNTPGTHIDDVGSRRPS